MSAEQELISAIAGCICDSAASPDLKHSALQLALVLVSGLGQLSPGAYFLRTDLFPAIVDVRPPFTLTSLATALTVPSLHHRSSSGQTLKDIPLKR
jgi:hypothetical protein